jgi:DNA-binding transcriptional LysR family regulator
MHNTSPNTFLRIRLKMRQLLLLIALDEQRNIHRAASSLQMTQPAASKQLKELEDLLNVRLFERRPHGMEPTLYGETMIRQARMALISLSLGHEDVAALKSGLTGRVTVGAIMSAAMTLMPRAIARVKQATPLMQVGVEFDTSNNLLDRLRRGTLDFLIARVNEGIDSAELAYEELADEPVCVVARCGHPLQREAALQLADIAGAAWVLPPQGSTLRHRCDTMFHRAGLAPPGNVVETTALLLTVSLLLQTDSVHLMSLDIARYYAGLDILTILPVEVPVQMDGFGIITRRNYLLSPSATILLDAVRATAREIYPEQ